MNRIKYFFAKIRLVFTACRAKSAKDLMNKVIISSRAKKEEIDYSYENFLKRCKQQEKAAVMLKRAKKENPGRPFLKVDLGIEHFNVSAVASNWINRLDIEKAITRHQYGDWGEVSEHHWLCNNEGVKDPCGIIRSCYLSAGNRYFFVETDKAAKTTNIYLGGEVI